MASNSDRREAPQGEGRSEEVRRQLARLVGIYPDLMTRDARTCRALLREALPWANLEVSVLVRVLEDDMLREIRHSHDPGEDDLNGWALRLEEAHGIKPEFAIWAVISWLDAFEGERSTPGGEAPSADPQSPHRETSRKEDFESEDSVPARPEPIRSKGSPRRKAVAPAVRGDQSVPEAAANVARGNQSRVGPVTSVELARDGANKESRTIERQAAPQPPPPTLPATPRGGPSLVRPNSARPDDSPPDSPGSGPSRSAPAAPEPTKPAASRQTTVSGVASQANLDAPLCPRCSSVGRYVASYRKWYCDQCHMGIPETPRQ
jgi:hypothetical protein